MTIIELIKLLETHDPNTRIMIKGYEYGYHDVTNLLPLTVILNNNNPDYGGPHEDAEIAGIQINKEKVQVLTLSYEQEEPSW